MSTDSLFATQNRLVVEGEQLVLHNVSTGSVDLASVADLPHSASTLRPRKRNVLRRIAHSFESVPPRDSDRVPAVWVPSGTYLILTGIPGSLQQRYGLEEEEGAVFLRSDTPDGTSPGELRFHNGVMIQLQDLQAGQVMEVLSLAGTRPTLYGPELQWK